VVGAALRIDDLPLPRRAAIAELLAHVARGERDLVDLYAAFAASPEPAPLREALGAMAQTRAARLPVLEALARAVPPEGAVSASSLPASEGRPERFQRLFEAEQHLEIAYRELSALLGDPARCPELPGLVEGAATLRRRLRRLYLRYS
jgi:hypothetical protein